ncbi:MAG: nitronate monooxygenase [Bacteroidetes bacterium]|nr:nitronate monooxygenase [Bacteroidota bacterium]
MSEKPSITELLHISFPLIMAPMFLVSNKEMLMAGMRGGIMSVFPTLNFRKEGELGSILDELQTYQSAMSKGNYGVNLIVQSSNPFYKKHLEICIAKKVPFFITSLGNPKEVIEKAHSYGAKVFCDVTTLAHAQKCYDVNCDGFIAVGQGAGGHAGPNPLQVLVPALKKHFPNKPIIAAGGIVSGQGLLSVMVLGAEGASIGTRFIASKECTVTEAYKQGILNAGMDDIVMTTKLSGSPCTIINTPEAKKMGYTQSWFERVMSNNPNTKKWFKTLVQYRGMKKLEQSVLPNNYNRLWCAGKSAELIDGIQTCQEIIDGIQQEYNDTLQEFANKCK